MTMENTVPLELEHVSKSFQISGNRRIYAVLDVSFKIECGKTLGLVGASGCGKTTVGFLAAGIYRPDNGIVRIQGEERRRHENKTTVQVVFQNPVASLNPMFTVRRTLLDYNRIHHIRGSKREDDRFVAKLLDLVRLDSSFSNYYPHELSGGQCQRVCIARALSARPDVLICDEITTALDVSTQAKLINTLLELQRETGISYLFISHDIGLIAQISNTIAVMHSGKIVESGESDEILECPVHPVTKHMLHIARKKTFT